MVAVRKSIGKTRPRGQYLNSNIIIHALETLYTSQESYPRVARHLQDIRSTIKQTPMPQKTTNLLSFISLLCCTLQALAAPIEATTETHMQSWCNVVTLSILQIKLKPCVAAKFEAVSVKSSLGREIMLREYLTATNTKNNATPRAFS